MHIFAAALTACLLASSAAAQYSEAPDLDEDGCIALGAKMDADAKEKRKPTEEEQNTFDQCVDFLNCDEARGADEQTKRTAAAANETLIRFVLKTCTGYDPPKGGK